MKTALQKFICFSSIALLVLACSTKNDALLNRKFHALTTQYNILYNGNIAFDKGVNNLRDQYHDNFWEILPIERMQPELRGLTDEEPKDPDFQLAEDKATKAIQKHSMYIGGREKNPQMDESYLLLGKARYHDNRFIPALEAFNYILYKYPNSGRINEAKVWREKTNLRLMYDELAIQNVKKMLKDKRLKGQVKADALAVMAQGYLNLSYTDSAVAPLLEARDLTERTEERARFSFILGQIYGRLEQSEKAVASFQEVIDMKRSSPRAYVLQAHAGQLQYGLSKPPDSTAFFAKYRGLLKDRENRAYLDLLHRQVGLFYEKTGRFPLAIAEFKESVKHSKGDEYLKSANYKSLADIYFNSARYEVAGQYYDSTLTILRPGSNEFYQINKKRENLQDVVMFERTAKENDSILNVVAMNPVQQQAYFEGLIDQLKKQDAKKALLAEKQSNHSGAGSPFGTVNTAGMPGANTAAPNSAGGSNFYFYSQNAVAYGKLEFKKRYGNRALVENWRLSSLNTAVAEVPETDIDLGEDLVDSNEKEENMRYSADFYRGQLPDDPAEILSLTKDRNFAYFQLGSIYSEKFAEYELAAQRYEALLLMNPEERLIVPAQYNLYKIYLIINPQKAASVKQRLLDLYPDSRYAQLLLNKPVEDEMGSSPESAYSELYREFEAGKYLEVLPKLDRSILQYVDSDFLPKFELLKANLIGRLEGVDAYKKALNDVALSYAGKPEGKEAERIINRDIPKLSALELRVAESEHWKIVFPIAVSDWDAAASLAAKLERYAIDRQNNKIKFSRDYYSASQGFFVIHGLSSQAQAQSVVAYLNQAREYQVDRPAVIISSENYTVIQIKKNWDVYLQSLKE